MEVDARFTLTQLRYFVAAAETRSMTAAALRLVIAQSAVSTAVSNLEHALGTQLFIRRKAKGLTLTPSGEDFLLQARALLTHAQDVADNARGGGTTLTGPVSVGCFITLAPFVLPTLLTAFAERYPGIRVSVLEGEAGEVDRALHDGRTDFALTYDLGLSPTVTREVVASVSAYALVPADHRLAARSVVDLAELAGEPLVLLDLPHSRDYFWSLVTSTGAAPTVRHRSQSYETVRSLVAAGYGYSILNQRPATDQTYAGGDVAVLPLSNSHPPLNIVIARLTGARQTIRSQALIDVIRNVDVTRSITADPGASHR